jgi:hypothetical protein
MTPLADPVAEAERILAAAQDQHVLLRLMGGVAIRLRCPSVRATDRTYRDLDFMAAAGFGRQLEVLFPTLGYLADQTFNKLHGAQRLMFWDDANGRQVDVLIDRLDMSHSLDLRQRLNCDAQTLCLADLLLSKLQIFQISDRDLLDIAAMLHDHPIAETDAAGINVEYLSRLWAADWGLFRTSQINLERMCRMDSAALGADGYDVGAQARELLQRMEATSKSLVWTVRALIGDRVRWYNLPEEVGR